MKKIALIAHDEKKKDMVQWALHNKEFLKDYKLCGTGTTGKLVANALNMEVELFASGPLGGDQQIGSRITEGEIDILFFFWDPMSAQPHDVDVKALLRVAMVYNIPVACNRASANYLITSPLINK